MGESSESNIERLIVYLPASQFQEVEKMVPEATSVSSKAEGLK